MKNWIKKFGLLMMFVNAFVFFSNAQAQKNADKDTKAWRYEIEVVQTGVQGTYLIKVWSYSKKPEVAIEQAKKNAVHGIIFKGFPTLGSVAGQRSLANNGNLEEEKSDFFAQFFADGGKYMKFVNVIANGAIDAGDLIKIGKEYKIGVVVSVNVSALRKELEDSKIITSLASSQTGKKPTLIVVPSDVWCFKNGYILEFDNQGNKEKIPDYKRAFQESTELSNVVSALGELMGERGFPLEKMIEIIKEKQEDNAENILLESKSGAGISENPIDKLKKVVKADIWMQIDWTVNEMGSRKSITYTLEGVDAYTNKGIAGGMPKTGNLLSSSAVVVNMLKTAVLADIDGFNNQLLSHFEDMNLNGREITIRIKKFDSWDGDLEKEYDGKELNSYIEEWLTKNCVKGQFSTSESTENMMLFKQVRIPIYNEAGVAIDAKAFCKGLQNYLKKEPFLITNKLMTKGLGQVTIVLGEK